MLRAPARFDGIVADIGWFFGQAHYRSLGPSIAARKPVFKAIYRCARIAARTRLGAAALIGVAFLFYPQFRRPVREGSVFEFGLSANNERAFRRLNAIMEGHEGWRVEMNRASVSLARRIGWLSLRRLWRAAAALAEGRGEDPFVTVQQALGCAALLLFERALERREPALVVVANDHSPTCVALRRIAAERGLRVVYIQHAPVNRYFPPLRFDLSILYDEASRKDYECAGRAQGVSAPPPVVILSPFGESFEQPVVAQLPLRIGICLGLVTDRKAVAEIAGELDRSPHVEAIFIRPHPRSRKEDRRLLAGEKITIRPRGESLAAFLADVDIVLVPNSGVCVECLHFGKPTFHMAGADRDVVDHYGFIANGILPLFDPARIGDPKALNAPFDRRWKERFSRYDATGSASPAQMERTVRRAVAALLARAETDNGEKHECP